MNRTRQHRTDHSSHDRGDSLIEVVMTMVIIAITVTALLTALASTTNAATSHRNIVVADSAVRNAAETVKLAATGCQVVGGVPQTVATNFSWPAGFTHTVKFDSTTVINGSKAATDTATLPCPLLTGTADQTTSLVYIEVVTPTGTKDSMSLRVRTP